MLPPFNKLSILIAAYNEADSLARCLEGVLAAALPPGIAREVILVDDGSTDRTWAIAQRLAAEHSTLRIFQQSRNQGKGAALRRAIEEMSGDLVIFQDADLEYDPGDYARMLKPIIDGRADVVFGSRFTGQERKVLYFWHTMGNQFLTLLANMFNDTNLTDMESCYKAFTAQSLRAIPLESDRFGIEPEIAAKVARNRLRMFEVPVNYNGRRYDEGKKITWKDGVAALWFIVKYRFTSRYADSGKVTLDALEAAPKFNQWMYESIRPWIGRRVAELGVGSGNLSQHIRHHESVLLTDYRIDYLEKLRTKWSHLPGLQIGKLDMTQSADYLLLRAFVPDTVVFLNVLEHLEDDRAVLANLFENLPKGCRLVILVPFNQRLYSEFDKQLGHFRRYSHGELESKMHAAGFDVERQFFFNKIGVLAWYVANTLGGQKALTRFQLRVYNFLTPLFRRCDQILPTAGLSTVVVGSVGTRKDAQVFAQRQNGGEGAL